LQEIAWPGLGGLGTLRCGQEGNGQHYEERETDFIEHRGYMQQFLERCSKKMNWTCQAAQAGALSL
jgi:hypothetical protein